MMGQLINVLNKQNDLGYKRFRKTGIVMAVGGSGDENPTSEGMKLQ